MSHHGREDDTSDTCNVDWHHVNLSRYASAVVLIRAIANRGANPQITYTAQAHVLCDRWLEENGFECEATRRKRREQRAAELDSQIAKLQQERALLK